MQGTLTAARHPTSRSHVSGELSARSYQTTALDMQPSLWGLALTECLSGACMPTPHCTQQVDPTPQKSGGAILTPLQPGGQEGGMGRLKLWSHEPQDNSLTQPHEELSEAWPQARSV